MTSTASRSNEKRLRIIIREDGTKKKNSTSNSNIISLPTRSNLFARLNPNIVKSLYDDAITNTTSVGYPSSIIPNNDTRQDISGGWNILDYPPLTTTSTLSSSLSPPSLGIEFLPLSIKFDHSDIEIYVSYNGGLINTNFGTTAVTEGKQYFEKNNDFIELPRSVIPQKQQEEGEQQHVWCTVRSLSYVQDAKFVYIEPMSTSDWELIEIMSEEIESYGLLNQISIIYPNQIIPLVVSSVTKDVAYVKVLPSTFGIVDDDDDDDNFYENNDITNKSDDDQNEHSNEEEEEESSLDTDSSTSNDEDYFDEWYNGEDNDQGLKLNQISSGCTCLRLVANTEVIITPKPRGSTGLADDGSNHNIQTLRVYPSWDDWSLQMKNLLSLNSPEIMNEDPINHHDDDNGSEHHTSTKTTTCAKLQPPQLTMLINPKTLSKCVSSSNDPIQAWPSRSSSESQMIALVWKAPALHDSSINTNNESEEDPYRIQYNHENGEINTNYITAHILPSNDVPLGHVVLNSFLRRGLGITPLYDKVFLRLLTRDEVKSKIDKLYTELLMDGSVHISLEEQLTSSPSVRTMANDTNKIPKPWQLPSCCFEKNDAPSFFQKQWNRNSETKDQPATSSLLEQFKFMLHEDIPEDDKDLLVNPNSIISLPWSKKSQKDEARMYRVVFCSPQHTIPEEDCSSPLLLFVRIHDLLSIIISNEQRQNLEDDAVNYGKNGRNWPKISSDNYFLNLLPRTPHLSLNNNEEYPCSDESRSDESLLPKFEGIREGCNVIISGEAGSGRTHSCLVLAAQARLTKGYATTYVDCQTLQLSASVRMKDILNELTEAFRKALEVRPSTLILDNVDELIPNLLDSSDDQDTSAQQAQVNPVAIDQAKLICDHLCNLKNDARSVCQSFEGTPLLQSEEEASRMLDDDIIIICTCHDKVKISPRFLNVLGCYQIVNVASPNGSERMELFSRMFQEMVSSFHMTLPDLNHVSLETPIIKYHNFGKETEGFRPKDLEVLAARVHHLLHAKYLGGSSDSADQSLDVVSLVREAVSVFTPISRHDITTEDTPISAGLSDIGGLFRVKEELSEIILLPVKFRAIYRKAPTKLPRGMLLYGPPGCGKTLIAKAVANDCGLNLITCRGPELLDRYIGASEAKVRQLFARAHAAAPSMLFFDEFDALAPRRGTDHTGVTDRVVNQLLTFLDGVEDTCGGKVVYIVGATSRPDKIDPALLRPGRLEKHLYVGYPENKLEWDDLLSCIFSSSNIDSDVNELVSSGNILDQLSRSVPQLHLFTGADLNAVMDTAHLNAVHEHLSRLENSTKINEATENSKQPIVINYKHLTDALVSTRPSLSHDDRRLLNDIYASFTKSGTLNGGNNNAQTFPNGSSPDTHSRSGNDTDASRTSSSSRSQLMTALK